MLVSHRHASYLNCSRVLTYVIVCTFAGLLAIPDDFPSHTHVCLSAGPSYKRGPPKGYINAIEQRMQHFEALIGVIMQTSDPRAASLISDLGQDELARAILNRVDAGRFVRRTVFFLRSPPVG